jgi:hypothetical protein
VASRIPETANKIQNGIILMFNAVPCPFPALRHP